MFRAVAVLVGGFGVLALAAPPLHAQALERVAYVSAVDAKSRAPLTELAAGDLRIREDGVLREVLRIAPASSPMPVAILVDNSELAQHTVADLRKGLTSFITGLGAIGPISIVTLADRPTIAQDYTTDHQKLLAAVQRIFPQPGSGATLLDGIIEVSKGLERRDADRAAVVAITTDAAKEFSERHYTEVTDALKKSTAMFSALTLTLPGKGPATDIERNRAVVLDRGTRETGGSLVEVLTSQAYESRLTELAAILTHQFKVTYARPETLIPPEKLEIVSAKTGVDVWGGAARGQKPR